MQTLGAIQELVWRKGDERCERSYKIPALTKEQEQYMQAQQIQAEQIQAQQIQAQQIQAQHMVEPVQAQHTQKQTKEQAPPIQQDGFRQATNKREEASAKMNERYLVGQATQNPFMPSNNYVQDIENQMNFLTPQKGC
jgi:hypothetical protein